MAVIRSAGAVVFRREKGQILYLILRYAQGHWDFPKGHIEKGEREEETVRRETAEETGIRDVVFVPGFFVTIRYWLWPRKGEERKKPTLKFVVFFLAETRTAEVRLSFEHIDFSWLPYEKAVRQLTYKNAKDILKKAHAFSLTHTR